MANLASLAVVILAAGQGTRMCSNLPKVLHQVGGRSMLDWAIIAAQEAGAAKIIVVAGPHAPQVGAHVEARLGKGALAIQDHPLGTAHAVLAARDSLGDFSGDLLVTYADAPLIRAAHFAALRDGLDGADFVVMGFEAADPTGYGRLILDTDGALVGIVEEKDASPAQRAITICNSGVMVGPCAQMLRLLQRVGNANAKGEYYLTDVIGLARASGARCAMVLAEERAVLGVNSRSQLAQAEAAFQAAARASALQAGVTLMDPQTVYFSFDTAIAADVEIEPNVVFGPGVQISAGARIRAFSHLEGALIGAGCEVGPFARLRPGTSLAERVKIGNFVEVKNTQMSPGAKANHLSYLGDCLVGPRANIGAGTITCNYDGFAKHRTLIGEDAFIGSNTALVAPVRVGARAYTGSGSVITRDVPAGALAVGRARQQDYAGWADQFRAKAGARKAAKDA